MPKYTAELYLNTGVLYHNFEAEDDDAARKHITENTKNSDRKDWPSRDLSDSACGADVKVIYLNRLANDGIIGEGNILAIKKGVTLKSKTPYPGDAQEFVRKVAALPIIAFQRAEIEVLINEARKLCGMED